MATGKEILKVRVAHSTLGRSCSNENSGVCTPITTSPASLYFAAQLLTYGIGRSELIHVYVQKFTSTTLPRNDFVLSALELIQPTALPRSGMDAGRWLCEKTKAPTSPAAIAMTPILRFIDFLRYRASSRRPLRTAVRRRCRTLLGAHCFYGRFKASPRAKKRTGRAKQRLESALLSLVLLRLWWLQYCLLCFSALLAFGIRARNE